jgi:hypothetical protein
MTTTYLWIRIPCLECCVDKPNLNLVGSKALLDWSDPDLGPERWVQVQAETGSNHLDKIIVQFTPN